MTTVRMGTKDHVSTNEGFLDSGVGGAALGLKPSSLLKWPIFLV